MEARRVAIALNNIAVSLLCKGRVNEALESFGDAVAILKQISSTDMGCDSRSTSTVLEGAALSDMLQRANFHLSLSYNQANESEYQLPLTFTVVAEDDIAPAVAKIVERDMGTDDWLQSSSVLLVRLEQQQQQQQHQDKPINMDLESALILLNFGNAYRSSTIGDVDYFCHGALKLYELSYSLLQSSVAHVKEHSSTEHEHHLACFLMVLQAFLSLGICMGLGDQIERSYLDYQDMKESFQLVHTLQRQVFQQTNVAAAA